MIDFAAVVCINVARVVETAVDDDNEDSSEGCQFWIIELQLPFDLTVAGFKKVQPGVTRSEGTRGHGK